MGAFFGRASIGAALVLVIAGCGSNNPIGIGGNGGGNNTTTLAEYDISLKKWQTLGPLHYRIVVTKTCECATDLQRPTRVTVLRNATQGLETIEDVVDVGTGQPVTGERRTSAKSVDGLLVLISQGLALNPQETKNKMSSESSAIMIDPVTSIPGDEIVYKVTVFETLP